jgi:hypothetical protein
MEAGGRSGPSGLAEDGAEKLFCPRGSAQHFENAHFGQENPRKSKPFSVEQFGPSLGWLGPAWQDLDPALTKNILAMYVVCRPLPSPPHSAYIWVAVREGGYGDKWASE